MDEQVKIVLEGREYPISRLSILKMRTVVPALTRVAVDSPEGMDAQRTVLVAVMQAANPAFKSDDFDKLQPTLVELTKAIVIARDMITGKPDEEDADQKGEASPGAAPESQ